MSTPTQSINNKASEFNIPTTKSQLESKKIDLLSAIFLPNNIVSELPLESRVSTEPKMDLLQDDKLEGKTIDLFSETFLPKTSSPSIAAQQDQIQELQDQLYEHALKKRFKEALQLAERMPLDSTARATALCIIADLASLPDEANNCGNFVFAERVALKISDVHILEKSTALYSLAINMKKSQKGDWKRIAESIPDKKMRAFILPEKVVIQPEKPLAQKPRKLSRQVMSSADLPSGTSQLSSAPYIMPLGIMPVRPPQKSRNPIPQESSYNHLPSIDDLCGDSAEPDYDEGESELACDSIGYSSLSPNSTTNLSKLVRQGNSHANLHDSETCDTSSYSSTSNRPDVQPMMPRKLVPKEKTYTDLSDALLEDTLGYSSALIFRMSEDEEKRTGSSYPLKKS